MSCPGAKVRTPTRTTVGRSRYCEPPCRLASRPGCRHSSGCRSAKFRSAEVTDPRNDHADTAIQRVSSVDRWRRKQRAVRTAQFTPRTPQNRRLSSHGRRELGIKQSSNYLRTVTKRPQNYVVFHDYFNGD